jgi:hypothetical protein
MTAQDVAALLGVPVSWVYLQTHSGRIPTFDGRVATTPSTPRLARPRRRARRGRSRARSVTPSRAFWPARPFGSLVELDAVYADWRDRVALPRRHATGRFIVAERLAVERDALRRLPPICFDAAGCRCSRVPLDGYLKHAGSFYRAPEALIHQRVELRFDRDRIWICYRGQTVARCPRSYVAGTWQPAPRMRPEAPPVASVAPIAAPEAVPPVLSDYAELCA